MATRTRSRSSASRSTPKGPARRGTKQPQLLIEQRPAESAPVRYVCTGRPLKVGTRVLHEGVEVPGAASWPRVDAWVSARRIRPVGADEAYTPYEDFCAAWDEEHPPEPEAEPEKAEGEAQQAEGEGEKPEGQQESAESGQEKPEGEGEQQESQQPQEGEQEQPGEQE